MIKSDGIQTSNNNFDYKQSMNQSFYFIENINLNDIEQWFWYIVLL